MRNAVFGQIVRAVVPNGLRFPTEVVRQHVSLVAFRKFPEERFVPVNAVAHYNDVERAVLKKVGVLGRNVTWSGAVCRNKTRFVWLFFTLITILFITDVVAVASNEFHDPSVCRKNLFLVYALFEIACQEKDEKMVGG
jgi:hypothetical protein